MKIRNNVIQGSSADMVKLALVLIWKYINDNNLRSKVKLVMQVHDQITTICEEKIAEEWQGILTDLMEKAAKIILPSGLLKAETNISKTWQK